MRKRLELAAQIARHQLKAVADAENRQTARPNLLVDAEGVGAKRALRAAGQNDRSRVAALDLFPRRIVRDDFRINACFTDTARDQLRILRAEVDDDDRRRPRESSHGHEDELGVRLRHPRAGPLRSLRQLNTCAGNS